MHANDLKLLKNDLDGNNPQLQKLNDFFGSQPDYMEYGTSSKYKNPACLSKLNELSYEFMSYGILDLPLLLQEAFFVLKRDRLS